MEKQELKTIRNNILKRNKEGERMIICLKENGQR